MLLLTAARFQFARTSLIGHQWALLSLPCACPYSDSVRGLAIVPSLGLASASHDGYYHTIQ